MGEERLTTFSNFQFKRALLAGENIRLPCQNTPETVGKKRKEKRAHTVGGGNPELCKQRAMSHSVLMYMLYIQDFK